SLALGTQRVLRAEHTRRARQLVLPLGDLVGHALPILAQRHHAIQVDETDRRQHGEAQYDALVTQQFAAIPVLQHVPQALEPRTQRGHRTPSATMEKRSLSPCLVVGEAKFTFLKRFDFPSAVSRSEAERACPSRVRRPLRRLRPVRYASAGISSVSSFISGVTWGSRPSLRVSTSFWS